ncbi:MAG: hypothetical protein HYV63_07735 [Candidatus Schekmanbacteria bacterium]|nr:hypothetical protein [Candidatus Schekmanbacteria bacterium]
MSTAPAIDIPALDLLYEDGIPMDSPWHRDQMNLLIALLHGATICDPMRTGPLAAPAHSCSGKHTGRLFRVVPEGHARGL